MYILYISQYWINVLNVYFYLIRFWLQFSLHRLKPRVVSILFPQTRGCVLGNAHVLHEYLYNAFNQWSVLWRKESEKIVQWESALQIPVGATNNMAEPELREVQSVFGIDYFTHIRSQTLKYLLEGNDVSFPYEPVVESLWLTKLFLS